MLLLSYSAKCLLAFWRVLMGDWAPKPWEFSLASLTQYTTPVFPKESEFISKPSSTDSAMTPAPVLPPTSELPGKRSRWCRHAPRDGRRRAVSCATCCAHVWRRSRRSAFFEQLRVQSSQSRARGGMRVKASLHLARLYGGIEVGSNAKVSAGEDGVPVGAEEEGEGWREASEVIAFLTVRRAKIPLTRHVRLWANGRTV
ncbi:hypothetical protein B0H10DRAFT_640669 [Mycena sp. CBHHK59/15]|nr:hypothetical protein B0H10DRAFT_640669 [Mycena sp. CBHHK59/15]